MSPEVVGIDIFDQKYDQLVEQKTEVTPVKHLIDESMEEPDKEMKPLEEPEPEIFTTPDDLVSKLAN